MPKLSFIFPLFTLKIPIELRGLPNVTLLHKLLEKNWQPNGYINCLEAHLSLPVSISLQDCCWVQCRIVAITVTKNSTCKFKGHVSSNIKYSKQA